MEKTPELLYDNPTASTEIPHDDDSALLETEVSPERQLSYEELVTENAELRKLLEIKLPEVENSQKIILDENEKLNIENQELKNKLRDQKKDLIILQRRFSVLNNVVQKAKGLFAELHVELDTSKEWNDYNNMCLQTTGTEVMDNSDSEISLTNCNADISPNVISQEFDETQSSEFGSAQRISCQRVVPEPLTEPSPRLATTESLAQQKPLKQMAAAKPKLDFSSATAILRTTRPRRTPNPPRQTSNSKKQNNVKHGHNKSKDAGRKQICFCGRKFSTPGNLRRHVVTFTGQHKFVCSTCTCQFGSTSELRRHMKTRHNLNFPGRGCLACGNVFPTTSAVLLHSWRTHR